MTGDRFRFDPALERALANDPVPELPAGFADRIMAATRDRAPPLPQGPARRLLPAARSRWRSTRRLAVGVIAAGALTSAAAATGLLRNIGVELPSPGEVWAQLTGGNASPEPAPKAALVPVEPPAKPGLAAPVTIEGPVDTPEELEEAFRRIDAVREERRDTRRSNVDRRIDAAIERRREQGLPVPTPEEEARLRARIDEARQRAEEQRAAKQGELRKELRERVEQGEALTPEVLIEEQRAIAADTPAAQRLQRLRALPPEERRKAIRAWRERREQGAPPAALPADADKNSAPQPQPQPQPAPPADPSE